MQSFNGREAPLSYEKVTQEEVDAASGTTGRSGVYKWEFPEEFFDGNWYRIEVPEDKVGSSTNSYRNQCQATYGKKASIRRGTDGYIYVRRLDDDYQYQRRS